MNYTRNQAIEIVGIDIIQKLESFDCNPTGRLIYPAFEPEHANMEEFSSSLSLDDGRIITAYYYQSDEDLSDYSDDISLLVWEVDHFEII